jgi:hypothetical protein
MLHKIHIINYRWILTFQYLKITWYLSRQIFRPAQNLSNESKLDEGVTLCKLSVTPLGFRKSSKAFFTQKILQIFGGMQIGKQI